MGEPGPAYIEIPTDVSHPCSAATGAGRMDDRTPHRKPQPSPDAVRQAADAIRNATRPLVITGRGARGASNELVRFLDAVDALYLDTQESRGLVPSDHPAFAGAVRGAVDGPVRSCDRAGPEAGLPDGLRLACRLWRCPLHPYLRHRRRTDRQPARQPGTAGRCGPCAGRHYRCAWQ